jgi:hypothetical protein
MGTAHPLELGGMSFAKKGDALKYLQVMLQRYAPGDRVTDEDAVILRDALLRHPDSAAKIGEGVDHFVVRSAEYRTQCFWAVRIDGTTDRFSYRSCV